LLPGWASALWGPVRRLPAWSRLSQRSIGNQLAGPKIHVSHISDPHLAPLPQPHWSELIGKRAIGFLNWHRNRSLIHHTEVLNRVVADLRAAAPDHIALTGDLVNVSVAGEYRPARAWLQSLGSPTDVSLVPGNHDVYVHAGAAHLCSHWSEFMRGDETRGLEFPFVRRRGPLALIGLSSAVPTAPFMATGRLGSVQIARLAELLDRCEREGLFRVVLIHHPPVSSPQRHFKRLIDGPRFRKILARHGAELVLHGHDHVYSVFHLEGPRHPIPAVGVPSASQIPRAGHDPPGYNLCRIEGQTGAWRCEIIGHGLASNGARMTEINRVSYLA
jgi:3',5'-cyclic AMP phosphodiesterase CpdA